MKSILWIEDEATPSLHELFAKLVEKEYTYEVAENLAIARRKLEARDYDIIILDLLLPDPENRYEKGHLYHKYPGLKLIDELSKKEITWSKYPENIFILSVFAEDIEVRDFLAYAEIDESRIMIKGGLDSEGFFGIVNSI